AREPCRARLHLLTKSLFPRKRRRERHLRLSRRGALRRYDAGHSTVPRIRRRYETIVVAPDNLHVAELPLVRLHAIAAVRERRYGRVGKRAARTVGNQVRRQQLVMKASRAYGFRRRHPEVDDVDDRLEDRGEYGRSSGRPGD